MTTPILGMTELVASQAQPHIILNTNARILEAYTQLTVNAIQDSPPGSPVEGEAYIVGSSPTGAWVGHTDHVAVTIGGGWKFVAPVSGWFAYDQSQFLFLVYDNATSPAGWQVYLPAGEPAVKSVVQDSDLVITSNAVLQDTELSIALEAGTYQIEIDAYTSAHATPDMELAPAYTGTIASVRANVHSAGTSGNSVTTGTTLAVSQQTATQTYHYQAQFYLVASTAGTFKLQARQITSSATSVTFHAGSRMTVRAV